MNIHVVSYLLGLKMILVLATLATGEKNSTKEVLVDLEYLPEPFLDSYLPSREFEKLENGTCYELFGCFEKIPVYGLQSEPKDLKTVFTIKHKDVETDIVLESCSNCLEKDPGKCAKYPFDLQKLKDSPFRPDRRTIVIIGGYRSKTKNNWEERVAELWSQLESVNVILVDWKDGGKTVIYTNAAANSRPVARQLTVLLYYLAKLHGNVDLFNEKFTENFYLIGHSLGAHMAGFVGGDLAGSLGRITGLDPAGPSFDSLPGKFRIDKSDAQFVDIMHTNAGSKVLARESEYGSSIDAGHIDLWVNNGRHQPGCKNDILGCSHRLAGQYYESFLRDVRAMRSYLSHDYKPMYRLRAYRAETYGEFHDGASLAKYCPVASIDDNDLSYKDLDLCSIPIDLLAWPTDYKHELSVVHGLDFESASSQNRFYFYTKAAATSQLDHHMIRARVTKADTAPSRGMYESGVISKDGCSIRVGFLMDDGSHTTTSINSYKLIEFEEHHEVVFPFLAPDLATKKEIANLDSHDFYVKRDDDNSREFIPEDNLESLRSAIDQVFPSSVTLDGFALDKENKKQESGFLDKIKNWIQSIQETDEDEDSDDEEDKTITSNGTDCRLPIESFVVQPLRKFRRHLSAFYKRACIHHDQPNPEVKVVLLGERDPSPKRALFDESAGNCEADGMKLTLDTLIIGPLLSVARDDEIYDETLEVDPKILDKGGRSATSQAVGDTRHWFRLTVLLIFVVSIVILVSVVKMRKSKLLDKSDQRNLVEPSNGDPAGPEEC